MQSNLMVRRRKQSKYITLTNMCETCVTPTKFELVGEVSGQEEEKRWAKCTKCHHTMMLDLEVIRSEQNVPKETTVPVEECIDYSPKSNYSIGDAIYHKGWDDIGTVVSKELTSNGNQAIVVTFNKVGEKRLVENLG
jgi:hypothetical protein